MSKEGRSRTTEDRQERGEKAKPVPLPPKKSGWAEEVARSEIASTPSQTENWAVLRGVARRNPKRPRLSRKKEKKWTQCWKFQHFEHKQEDSDTRLNLYVLCDPPPQIVEMQAAQRKRTACEVRKLPQKTK